MNEPQRHTDQLDNRIDETLMMLRAAAIEQGMAVSGVHRVRMLGRRTARAARARRRGDRIALSFAQAGCCICSRQLVAHRDKSQSREFAVGIGWKADIGRQAVSANL